MATNYILEVKHLRKSYKDTEVLKDVSFKLEEGKIIGLLGRNGAGKTTLLKSILGLNHYESGEIYFQGQLINHENAIIKNRIGSLVDVVFYEDLTAYENMKISMMLTDYTNKKQMKEKTEKLLQFVDLLKVKDKKVKSFSFGMKQRLALAQSMITDPSLLILDEPFVGLDPIGSVEMIETLKSLSHEFGTCIIFSSHQLEDVKELAEQIIILSGGKIKLSDTYSSIEASGQSLIDLMR